MTDEIDYEKAFFQHIDEINALKHALDAASSEGAIMRKFVERWAKQPTIMELPDECEGGDPESAYNSAVYEARECLVAVSGKQ